MTLRDLTPWRARSVPAPLPFESGFDTLRREMDRLFDGFSRGFGMPSLADGFSDGVFLTPRLDVAETDTAYEVSVELPGIERDDLDVTVANGVLTIKGEKKAETEQKEKGRLYAERSYGAFQRSLSLPADADAGKVEASFKNGVLKLTIDKTAAAKAEVRRIDIKSK
ncbi:MAG: Hsp20/alpha crystallin family protein, partial [Rhodospirillales bacterium]|jgi:HSP20 family protein|nr:Hsp20/alpha crystallin family protein [Rhodospirillales bacterium]